MSTLSKWTPESDRNTWVECAVKHRGVPLAQALAEAGFEQAKEKASG